MIFDLISAHRRTIAALSIAMYETDDTDRLSALSDYRHAVGVELTHVARDLPADAHDRALAPVAGLDSADVTP